MENQESTPATLAPPAQSTLIAGCLLVIATIMLGVALMYTRSIMIPLVFALFLSYFISPWVDLMKKRARFPHWLAVMVSILGSLGLLAVFGLVVRGSVIHLINSFYLYEERLGVIAQNAVDFATRFDLVLDRDTLLARIKDLPIFTYVQSAASSFVGFVLDILLVLVFLIFLVSGSSAEKRSALGGEIDAKVREYILTKVLSNLLTSVAIWIIYITFDLDLALMFATICFVVCFIPTLGSIIATVLPLPIALVQYETAWPIWAVIAFPAVIQIFVGNFIEPKLLGRGLDLHPITILFSLMFWGLIWGIAGMFLAVPITAVLKLVMEKHELTRGFSELLAGRSPI
jgi:AI-2 transport protein TqsA